MELTPQDMKKRILFFSDDQMYGSHIDKNLESSDFVYLGWYQRFNKLVSAIKAIQPDFLLIELSGNIDLPIIQEVKKINRLISIVVISPKNDRSSILQALKSGAHGYLIKSADIQETIQDVCKLALGGVALSAPAAKSIVMGFWKTNNSPLTVTETKVLKFVSLGHTYSSLAKNLDIKKGTAKTHLKNIYRKLNIHRKSEALEVAYVERLIN
jgi:DNA-binding NarL/FixJ family response regulator